MDCNFHGSELWHQHIKVPSSKNEVRRQQHHKSTLCHVLRPLWSRDRDEIDKRRPRQQDSCPVCAHKRETPDLGFLSSKIHVLSFLVGFPLSHPTNLTLTIEASLRAHLFFSRKRWGALCVMRRTKHAGTYNFSHLRLIKAQGNGNNACQHSLIRWVTTASSILYILYRHAWSQVERRWVDQQTRRDLLRSSWGPMV